MNQETHTHTDAPGVFEPRHTRPPREQSLAPHLLLADQALVAVCVRFMGVSVTPAPVGRARPVNAAAVQRLYVKGVILRSGPTVSRGRNHAAHTHPWAPKRCPYARSSCLFGQWQWILRPSSPRSV